MAEKNTNLPYWTASDKGQIGLNGQQLRMYMITGPKSEVFTLLIHADDKYLVDKILSALAKSEA